MNPNVQMLERPERQSAAGQWSRGISRSSPPCGVGFWIALRTARCGLTAMAGQHRAPSPSWPISSDRDADFRDVLRLWAGDANAATGHGFGETVLPMRRFLSAYRYKPAGLDKRADLGAHPGAATPRGRRGETRRPDSGAAEVHVGGLHEDFHWSHRGKLDVPKERFIAYPHAGRDTDNTELLGWAGWDHAEQLCAGLLVSARTEEGWDTLCLIPLLAGLQ